jgi:hypothetical protein
MCVGLLQLLISITLAFVMVESPIWLLKMGKFYEAQIACRTICKVNECLDKTEHMIELLNLELGPESGQGQQDLGSDMGSGGSEDQYRMEG